MARRCLDKYTDSKKTETNDDDHDDDNDTKNSFKTATEYVPSNFSSDVETEWSWKRNVHIISLVIPLLAAILYCSTYAFKYTFSSKHLQKIDSNKNLLNHIFVKKDLFPSQDSNIWSEIYAGLTRLNEDPAKPAVYLLMFEEDAFTSSSCIVEIITTSANKYILNNNRWLLLNGSHISNHKNQDPGILIETLSQQMEYSRIVIVTDIQKVPAKLAQGFHFLVDEYNPKIGDSVYIFTLMVPKQRSNFSDMEIVEEILSTSWRELNINVRQALITRVTNVVLRISQENKVEVCPLKISSTIEVELPS